MPKKIKLRSPIDPRYALNRKRVIINQLFDESLIWKFYKGKPHGGLDIKTKTTYRWVRDKIKPLKIRRTKAEQEGTIPITASHDGYLTVEYNDTENGIYMKVKDGDWETLYFHLSSVRVWKGDDKMTSYEKKHGENFVKAGTIIGYGGNTGRFTTGAHLHFELRYKGKKIDPIPYFKDDLVYQRYRLSGSTYFYKGKEITQQQAQNI